jgi:hypothetical protein
MVLFCNDTNRGENVTEGKTTPVPLLSPTGVGRNYLAVKNNLKVVPLKYLPFLCSI